MMIFAPHPDPPPGATSVTYDKAPYVVEWKAKTGRWAGHWIYCVDGPAGDRCYALRRVGGPKPRVTVTLRSHRALVSIRSPEHP